MGEVGATFEVAQHEGDSHGFESAPAVVDGFLENSTAPCKLADFCVDLLSLLFPLSVVNDLGIGLPVG